MKFQRANASLTKLIFREFDWHSIRQPSFLIAYTLSFQETAKAGRFLRARRKAAPRAIEHPLKIWREKLKHGGIYEESKLGGKYTYLVLPIRKVFFFELCKYGWKQVETISQIHWRGVYSVSNRRGRRKKSTERVKIKLLVRYVSKGYKHELWCILCVILT